MLSLVVEVVEKLSPASRGKYSRSRSGVTATMPFSSSVRVTAVMSPAGRTAEGASRPKRAYSPNAAASTTTRIKTCFSPFRHRWEGVFTA